MVEYSILSGTGKSQFSKRNKAKPKESTMHNLLTHFNMELPERFIVYGMRYSIEVTISKNAHGSQLTKTYR
jgi:hypothetical protein